MKLLRPELCLGVAVLLSFLSLTFLLLSSAPNTPSREAGWAAHPVLHSGREAPVGQAEERLDAMERRIQEMRYSAYPQYPQYPPPFPSALASQGQMDGLVQQLSDVLARASRQAPAPSPPAVEKDWGGWGVPSTTTPEWQGQLKELREVGDSHWKADTSKEPLGGDKWPLDFHLVDSFAYPQLWANRMFGAMPTPSRVDLTFMTLRGMMTSVFEAPAMDPLIRLPRLKETGILLYNALTGELEEELEDADISQIYNPKRVEFILNTLSRAIETRSVHLKRKLLADYEHL
ncbi:unnamed protein product [Effrenium voratum]|nr:unnamed protein product [Effrenium voratum]